MQWATDKLTFEYEQNEKIFQSLATDKNRIKFMDIATDEWL